MKALNYRVTKHAIPGWIPFHEKEPRGIAYETDTHFVHIFGKDRGLWTISTGLTATQAKSGTLREWIDQTFGAVEVVETSCEIGHTVHGVWRPGLYYSGEVLQGLSATSSGLRLAEQALLLLIQRLDELLHFIEPSPVTLQAYRHKARELLILSCTEVENSWKAYLRIANVEPPSRGDFTTNDYVKLLGPLHLAEYLISLPRYADVEGLIPAKRSKKWGTPGVTEHAGTGVFFEGNWRKASHWVGAAAYDENGKPVKGAVVRIPVSNLVVEADIRSQGSLEVRRDRIPVDEAEVLLFPLTVTGKWTPLLAAVEVVRRTRKSNPRS